MVDEYLRDALVRHMSDIYTRVDGSYRDMSARIIVATMAAFENEQLSRGYVANLQETIEATRLAVPPLCDSDRYDECSRAILGLLDGAQQILRY